MDQLLSNKQIETYVDKRIRFVVYDDLSSMQDWKDLFLDYDNILLLYSDPFKDIKVGHWVALKKVNNTIIFFDSYGTTPDVTLTQINYPYYPSLSRILYYTPFEIHYNPYKLQSPDSAVCGRYVSLFLKYCIDDVDKFSEILIGLAEDMELTIDQLVLCLTKNIV